MTTQKQTPSRASWIQQVAYSAGTLAIIGMSWSSLPTRADPIPRSQLCGDMPRLSKLLDELDAIRKNDKPFDANAGIPQGPSESYVRFRREALGPCVRVERCDVLKRTADLCNELESYLDQRELERGKAIQEADNKRRRAATEAQKAADEDAAAAAHAAEIAPVMREAKSHGYRFMAEHGLRAALQAFVANPRSIADLKKTLIVLRDSGINSDALFEAIQVPKGGRAVFSDGDWTVVFRGFKSPVYAGTPITSLGCPYVHVVGTTNYKTALRTTEQAFVVEPAW